MSKEPKGYELDQVIAAIKFALGEITFNEFERKHTTGKGHKWNHMQFVRRQPFIWFLLFERLPIPYRIKACMDLEGLSVQSLKANMRITAGNYINKRKFELMNEEGIQPTLLRLAVVLDIPLKYLRGFDPSSLVIEDFEEYDQLIVNNKKSLADVISWAMKDEVYRIIEGFIIDNSNQEIPFVHKNRIYVRVDKNVNYFRFEIFLESKPYASVGQIKELLKCFQGKVHYVYKEDSILRKIPKLTLLGTYENHQLELLEEYANDLSKQPGKERIYPF